MWESQQLPSLPAVSTLEGSISTCSSKVLRLDLRLHGRRSPLLVNNILFAGGPDRRANASVFTVPPSFSC